MSTCRSAGAQKRNRLQLRKRLRHVVQSNKLTSNECDGQEYRGHDRQRLHALIVGMVDGIEDEVNEVLALGCQRVHVFNYSTYMIHDIIQVDVSQGAQEVVLLGYRGA